jgi:acyl CoA:acetate/3-ketoacid CoA transferase
MEFEPEVSSSLKVMDKRIFREEVMGLVNGNQ